MFTLGYRFRPWTEAKAIADGPSILRYINDTARAFDVQRLIRVNHLVVRAELGRQRVTLDRRRATRRYG